MVLTCGICGEAGPVPPGIVSLAALAVTWLAMIGFAGREGLSRRLSLIAGLLGMLGAFWGGHIYVVLQSGLGQPGGDPWLLLRFWEGPKAVLGAFAGAALTALAVLAIARRPFLDYADAWVPAIALGYGVARLSCFLNGDDFGALSTLPWAVRFPPGTEAYAVHLARGWIGGSDALSLALHPTQLYHALAGFSMLILLWLRRPAWQGGRLAFAMGFYGVTRFLIEFFRDDYAWNGALLDSVQWLCLLLIASAFLLRRRCRTSVSQAVPMRMGEDHVATP